MISAITVISLLAVALTAGLVGLLAGLVTSAEAAALPDPPESLLVQPVEASVADLGFKDLDGRDVRLEAFRGSVVLLNFWASWCVPCREEMPALERLQRAYSDRGLVVVTVNFKETATKARAFIQEVQATGPVLLDPQGAAAGRLRVIGLPATFLLDRGARVIWKTLGERRWDSPPAREYFDRFVATP
ncbi:MAG TPA: redoxin domain-containing protein [Methylomirabilota bacterium]|nr:redoxin domain-containing protein [Methylomirabilota bacterium]